MQLKIKQHFAYVELYTVHENVTRTKEKQRSSPPQLLYVLLETCGFFGISIKLLECTHMCADRQGIQKANF